MRLIGRGVGDFGLYAFKDHDMKCKMTDKNGIYLRDEVMLPHKMVECRNSSCHPSIACTMLCKLVIIVSDPTVSSGVARVDRM